MSALRSISSPYSPSIHPKPTVKESLPELRIQPEATMQAERKPNNTVKDRNEGIIS